MLLDLGNLLNLHRLHVNGVIHVGAHFGKEYEHYKKLGINHGLFFEPTAATFEKLKENVNDPGFQIFNTAVGNFNGEVELYVEHDNQGQSNSILEPTRHLEDYPNIKFEEHKQTARIVRLDDFVPDHSQFNFLNIDVQGYELEVLKGASKLLENSIDCILSEINFDQLYKDGVNVDVLDEYLDQYSFVRVETKWWRKSCWGDGFYIKVKKPKIHPTDLGCLKIASRVLESLNISNPIIFDVGANLGTHSRIMMDHLSSNNQFELHLFEPNPVVHAQLVNTPIGKIARQVNNFGLSSQPGNLEFFVPTRKSSLGSRFKRKAFSENSSKWGEALKQTVEMSTIDNYLENEEVHQIAFLKIDTEGAELDVLKGSTDTLASKKVVCGQFEYGGTFEDAGITINHVVEFLDQYDYVVVDVENNTILDATTPDDFQMKNYLFIQRIHINHVF